jgi:predicted nucleotidyltransferase
MARNPERHELEAHREELAALCREHGVSELSVFGSQARGDARAGSDLDVLVTFEPGRAVGFLALARLQRELEALLGRRVDLVPKAGLKPVIRDAVLKEARLVYAA